MSTTQPIRTPEQLQLFKDYYRTVKPNGRNYRLIVLGLNSALRISDLLYLTYGDLYDHERNAWRTHLTVREQKTGKENRIYINREIRRAVRESGGLSQKAPDDWLFASQMQSARPLSRYQAYRVVKEAAAYAGLGHAPGAPDEYLQSLVLSGHPALSLHRPGRPGRSVCENPDLAAFYKKMKICSKVFGDCSDNIGVNKKCNILVENVAFFILPDQSRSIHPEKKNRKNGQRP